MLTEEHHENINSKEEELRIITTKSPIVHTSIIQKSLEECLLDGEQMTNDLFELYTSARESFNDYSIFIDEYEQDLKILTKNIDKIQKPINIYKIEEKKDIFEAGIDIYKRSFEKINNSINIILNILYDKKIPKEDKEKNTDRKKGFDLLHKQAKEELHKWKIFYKKMADSQKIKHW